jgi:hypothetical protein
MNDITELSDEELLRDLPPSTLYFWRDLLGDILGFVAKYPDESFEQIVERMEIRTDDAELREFIVELVRRAVKEAKH